VKALALALFLLAPGATPAQTSSQTPVVEMRDGGTSEVLQSIYIPPLLNAPFTATVHTEWTKPIPGGGSFTMVNERRVARDSRGRIYEERWLLVPKGGKLKSQMNVIQIADPRTRKLYNCFTLRSPHRCQLETFSEPATAIYKPAVRPTGPLPDGNGFTTHEELGTRNLQGIDTQGTRDTTTLNPGVFGNDTPLVSTREFWQAQQLGINLLSILDDPRTGRQTFTLTDVTTSEPDIQFFQIPDGYEVVDQRHP
jgi:hypothetical protein